MDSTHVEKMKPSMADYLTKQNKEREESCRFVGSGSEHEVPTQTDEGKKKRY